MRLKPLWRGGPVVKSLIQTVLAGVMTLSAVHCIDPAIADRSVDVPELEQPPLRPKSRRRITGRKLEL